MADETGLRNAKRARRRSAKTAFVADTLPMDQWTISPGYLRALYGDKAADTYIRLRDAEIARDLAAADID
jgi:hypothetical protein